MSTSSSFSESFFEYFTKISDLAVLMSVGRSYVLYRGQIQISVIKPTCPYSTYTDDALQHFGPPCLNISVLCDRYVTSTRRTTTIIRFLKTTVFPTFDMKCHIFFPRLLALGNVFE